MSDPMGPSIARPVVTYSGDIARSYETSMANSAAGHRPYDPGTTTAFERYDTSNQCPSLQQQPLMPPRVPPVSIYGYTTMDDQQEQRYQQEVAQHQLSMANVGLMKAEADQEPTGPLYPRWVRSSFSNRGRNLYPVLQAHVPVRLGDFRYASDGVFRHKFVREMRDNVPGPHESHWTENVPWGQRH